ncbi:hypothetical protein BD626DRAFT_625964 [Schizophyllum amplum]|uniref:Uncharacterized protein n=1 Tax=Schizophyllum amplum TaxID=97359 RepID=A0A550CRW2_9AGAR|nr:hypothetical protein BD626DRAFT_625964 [Auriculariopsis ampla]
MSGHGVKRYKTRGKLVSYFPKPKGRSGAKFSTPSAFISLPDELLLEVVNSYPRVSLHTKRTALYGEEYLVRHRSIYALSQTCRRLRNVFLPYVWQSIEAFASKYQVDDPAKPNRMNLPDGILWKKELATDLVRQLEIVTIRDPTLAPYVQTVTVWLSDYSWAGVWPEFCRALAELPNLHTLHIVYSMQATGRWIFEKRSFLEMLDRRSLPSVRNLAIPWKLANLLPSMPETQRLYFTDATPRQFSNGLTEPTKAGFAKLRELPNTVFTLTSNNLFELCGGRLKHIQVRLHEHRAKGDVEAQRIQQRFTKMAKRLRGLESLKVFSDESYDDIAFWADCTMLLIQPLEAVLRARAVPNSSAPNDAEPSTRTVRVTLVHRSGARKTVIAAAGQDDP